jgi:hypothetical protein
MCDFTKGKKNGVKAKGGEKNRKECHSIFFIFIIVWLLILFITYKLEN